MSDQYKGFKDSKGQWTHKGSVNAGTYDKQNGNTPAPQQPGESAASYQTRLNASR